MRVSSIAGDSSRLPQTRVRLDQFDRSLGLDRGRSRATEVVWYLTKCLFFLAPIPWPQRIKTGLLRLFGARIGSGIVIKPRVNIHLPWKLILGDHVWIGEEVLILNFEPVEIGSHVCISQRAFLCTGNHDFRSPNFRYRNAPIQIASGAWIGAQSFIGPGISIGTDCVVTAGSVASKNLPAGMICSGNPATPTKPRWPEP